MKAESKKIIQVILLIAVLVALVRLVVIFYQRHAAGRPAAEPRAAAPALDPDHYVRPRRLYLHDLESAQVLTQQPVWVREGYRYTIYPHRGGRTDFSREAGLLPPIERLDIRQVVRQPDPRGRGQQVVAVFSREDGTFALPIGTFSDGTYQFYADEVFFYDDPRELYRHWPEEVWQAIAQGEVRPGMNELQASFAAGMGIPESSDQPGTKVVRYPRGNNPVTVVYRNGRAMEIR